MELVMKNLYVITSSLADTGKGWLSSSIAAIIGVSTLIKIDPVLAIFQGHEKYDAADMSSDTQAYRALGNDFKADQIIRGGEVIQDFLQETAFNLEAFDIHQTRRPHPADLAYYFSKKLNHLAESKGNQDLVLEVGGSLSDRFLDFIGQGIQAFCEFNDYQLKVILLSYLEKSDDQAHPYKVNRVVDSIKLVPEIFGIKPHLVFIRDRATQGLMAQNGIVDHYLEKVAYRSILKPERVIYLREASQVSGVYDYLRTLHLF